MRIASLVSRLPHLAPPVLTAYLDTNPANPRNQSTPRGYAIWLKSAARDLANEQPPEARRQLRRQLRRIESHLNGLTNFSRGLVLFAGTDVWEEVKLQVTLHDELHWGKPSLQQMAWVLDEHRLRGAVVVDRSGAGFFRFWLGTVMEDEEMAFSIDTSDWRKPHLVGPATPGVQKQYGVQRDRVSSRLEAQRARFARDLAGRIGRWSHSEQISPVILVGEQRQIDSVYQAMPQKLRAHVALVPKVVPRTSPSEIQRELEPVLEDWEREYEEQEVTELLSVHDAARAVVGMEQTLEQLQQGRVRELVIARGLKGAARQCTNCGWVDRTADPVCPICGSMRRSRTLRTVIPELAGAFGVPMEIVAGAAAEELAKAGGIGAWLGARRKPIRKISVSVAEVSVPRRRRA